MHKPLLLLSLVLPLSAHAVSGRTADGCTYRIINGQYLTSCPKDKEVAKARTPAPIEAPTVAAPIAPEAVANYGDVPMRQNPNAPVPSVEILPPSSEVIVNKPAAPSIMNVGITTPSRVQVRGEYAIEETRAAHRRDERMNRALDKINVGISGGSTTISASGNSGLGLGATIATPLDEYFAVELGYSFARQDLNLGLNQRDTEKASISNFAPGPYNANDSRLQSHLVSLEAQGYFTNALRRFRPYLGAGVGFKSSTLDEKTNYNPYTGTGELIYPGSLSQTSFGGIGEAGAKVRVGKDVSLGFSFRYYFPFTRQAANLEQAPLNLYGSDGAPSDTRLSRSDDKLTGSSQYQLMGGVQYAF